MARVVAESRLEVLQNHLNPSSGSTPAALLRPNPTSGEFVSEQGYSVVLPEKLQTGKWNVYRSARSPLNLVTRFSNKPEVATLHDNFVHAAKSFPDHKYLGTRVRDDGKVGDYKWITYGEVSTARSAIGSGLVCHGVPKGSCVGLYFINRPEWMIVDHACSAYSFISVPLYDTLGPEAVKYIANHASIQAIFCVPQTFDTLVRFLPEIPTVRLIVVVGGTDDQFPLLSSTTGRKIISYSKFLTEGLANLRPFSAPKPDDIATICYTSGTTGTPKGVVLTHGNLIANVAGATFGIVLYPSDIYASYLPLAHIYERANQVLMVHYGSAVGFYQGDHLKLLEDLVLLKPTIFCSVPRVYNKLYAGITNAVKSSSPLQQRLFSSAYNAKKQAIFNRKKSSLMWDRLVFNKLKATLGGRVRYMVSGASPLSPDVMDFLRVCFGCQVVEGYGMTETSCVISNMDENDLLSGHVGAPNPACEIKLADVPEMNYTSDDQPYPRGEICVRGPIVFQGYYKDEAQTREVIDEDGWLHTGDIGLWLPGGRLKIIDRKKNIFKLAQGEYIAPEKIENVYATSKFVSQCFVYGDSFNSSLVVIVSVEQDNIKAWAASQGVKYEDLQQLCNDKRTRAAVLADLDAAGKAAQVLLFHSSVLHIMV
ncbi:OLC1v1020106C2 [Oldenlandia corymbosa var. corymbosa]|uniref:Long-chain-fatty-acid--CoA ligase n=1 Tax=Oldenlandia corymbosa var. corymbosa TaxID=529605 RepID=A0AAV1EG20_OLDCO|nr:OLC1v1020106C2 [Oldenlandia corymbosa var. corymbosa]